MEDDDNYYAVMTRRHGRTLFDAIEQNDSMTERHIRQIFRQVASAVSHLHHLGIVHRDIKDTNILLTDNNEVLLIDFGSAAYYRSGRLFTTFCGTRDSMAPEILDGEAYAGPP
jgi:serine/threonine protein kinase